MNNKQLTFAREYRGITQTKLSSMVEGLSQSNLSKFEKGMGPLSDDILCKIMSVLGFPYEFLQLRIENDFDKNFRKKSSLKASEKSKIERFVESVSYVIDCMSEDLEIPDFNFKCIDVETGVTPEDIARFIRRQFRLGISPIHNMCNFLERNGILVYEWDCDYESFDGISLTTTKGNRVIIINKNKSADRKRNSLAHELGHTIMHNNPDFFIVSSRNKEDEATRFASELLMPEEGIRSSLTNVRFSELLELKRYWQTSMSSIIVRARRLNQIDDKKYKTLMVELSRQGWRINEPQFGVDMDEPVLIKKMYSVMIDTIGYDDESLSKRMFIPKDMLKSIFGNRSRMMPLMSICAT